MADGVPITAGSGTNTATDDINNTNWHYQRVKLSDGTADSEVHLKIVAEDAQHTSGDTGIVAMGVRKDAPANLSGTDNDYEPLQVSGGGLWTRPLYKVVTVTASLTRPNDTTQYVANDAISNSTSAPTDYTFSNCARVSGGSGWITDVIIQTDADATTRLSGELYLFDTTVTLTNDNSAFALSDADMEKLVACIPFSFFDTGNQGVAVIPGLNFGFTCVGSANLYGAIRVRATYTPVALEKFTTRLKIIQAD